MADFQSRFDAAADPAGDPQDYLKQQQAFAKVGLNPATETQSVPGGQGGPAPLSPQSTGNLRLPPNPDPQEPHLQDVPKAPHEEFQDALNVFKDPAIVLAGLGSLFTRRPLTTAMNAAAGAMDGYRQGQQDTFTLKQKEWEDATKAALEQNNIELEKYKLAWDKHDRNATESFAKLYAHSAEFNDPVMRSAVQSGKFDVVEKLIMMREQARTGFEKAMDTKIAGEQAEEAYVKHLEGDLGVIEQAKRIRNYDQAPPASYSMRSPQNRAIMNILDTLPGPDSHYDAAKYQGKVSAERVTASAPARADTKSLTSLTSMVNSIESYQKTAALNGKKLKELVDKVDKTGVPIIEKWRRGGAAALGDPDVSVFDAQLKLYIPEVAKIMNNPNLTGQLTDTARADVAAILNGSASARQIKAVVDLFESDFVRRLGPLREQITKVKEDLKADSPTNQGASAPASDGWSNFRVH